jgi:hypothetical protein
MTKLYFETPFVYGLGSTGSAMPVDQNTTRQVRISDALNAAMGRSFDVDIEQWLLPSAPNRQRRLVVTLPSAISPNTGLSFKVLNSSDRQPDWLHSAGMFRYPNMGAVAEGTERIINYDSFGAVVFLPFNTVRTIPAGTASVRWESTGTIGEGLQPLLLRDGFSQHIPTFTNIAPARRFDYGFGEVSLRSIMDLDLTEVAMMTGSNPAKLRIDGQLKSLLLPMIPAIRETTHFTMDVSIRPSENPLASSLVELTLDRFNFEFNLSISNMAMLTLIKGLVRDVAENAVSDLEDRINRDIADTVQDIDIPLDNVAPPPRRPVRWSVRSTYMASDTHRTHGVINGIVAEVYGVWNDGRGVVQV